METLRESTSVEAESCPPETVASSVGSTTGVDDICRICLSTRQQMISIHSTVSEYNQKTLYAMLLCVCLPLNDRETVPGLPEQVCRNCKWQLLSAYDLYETTLASDEQLRSQTHTALKGALDDDGEQSIAAHEALPLEEDPKQTTLERRSNEMALTIDDQLEHQDNAAEVLLQQEVPKQTTVKRSSNEMASKTDDQMQHQDHSAEALLQQEVPKQTTLKGSSNEMALTIDHQMQHQDHSAEALLQQEVPKQTALKRSLSEMAMATDDQPEQQESKKISLMACVKEETFDGECGEDSLASSLMMNENAADLLEMSVMETTADGEDSSSVPDPLKAIIDEHCLEDSSTSSYMCGLCKQCFAYKSQCRLHIVQKHDPAKPFKCGECFCTLTTHQRLERHQITVHGSRRLKDDTATGVPEGSDNGVKTYTCPICQKVFNSGVRFRRHKSVHVVHNRPFKCEVCLYRFHTKAQLTQHRKSHVPKSSPTASSPGPDSSGGGWYTCELCEEVFPGKRARTMHQKKMHHVHPSAGGGGPRQEEREKSEYTCIICQASFARETVLNTHMKMHELLAAEKEKERRFDLEKLVKQELQQQMKLNVPPLPPLSPEVVDKSNDVLEPLVFGLVPVAKDGAGSSSSSSNNSNNNNNNNSATSINNNSASGSEANRPDPSSAKQKEIPKSDIAYLCTICEREFDDRELLKKHQKEAHPKLNVDIVSSQNRPGVGREGPARSSGILPRLTAKPGLSLKHINGKLNKSTMEHNAESPGHENSGKKVETEASDGSDPFQCHLCHKIFSYKCHLTKHVKENHDKSKPYGCKVCHYRFGYRGTLLRHQLEHSSQNVRPGGHGSIIFKCRICSAKFLELRQLNFHLKSHQKPTDDPGRKVQLIQCHECSQIFSDRSQFRLHMEFEHDQDMDLMLDHQSPASHHPRRDRAAFRERLHVLDGHEQVGSSSSLRHSGRMANSSLTDNNPPSEEDNPFLNDLSIIKVEANYE